jgi:hypothetical protein
MPSDKSEKIKFWIVIVLVLVMVIVAYFRFWHKKGSAAPDRFAAQPARTQPVATATTIDRQPDDPTPDRPPEVALPPVKRDIFRPLKLPSAPAGRPRKIRPAKSPPARVPNFKLGGTIVSGKESIAIINDRFLRTGDTIEAFKVVRIENNKVQLVSGIKNIELKMIDNE